MDAGRVLLYVATAALAAAAWGWSRRDPAHRPLAFWALGAVVTDWSRLGIAALKAGEPVPYRGRGLVLALADRTLVMVWAFAFVALALWYFTPWRGWRLLAALALPFAVAMGFAFDYPAVRGETYAVLLRTVAILAALTTWSAIVWGTLWRRDVTPTLAHLTVMFFACAEAMVLALPYAGDLFAEWDTTRLIVLITMAASLIAHLYAFTRPRPTEVP